MEFGVFLNHPVNLSRAHAPSGSIPGAGYRTVPEAFRSFSFHSVPSVERGCRAAEAVGCPGLFHKDSVQPQGKCFSSKRLTEADLDTHPPHPGTGVLHR